MQAHPAQLENTRLPKHLLVEQMAKAASAQQVAAARFVGPAQPERSEPGQAGREFFRIETRVHATWSSPGK